LSFYCNPIPKPATVLWLEASLIGLAKWVAENFENFKKDVSLT
jgi:hypothetical protein